jgi:hypothetical protein
MIKSALSIPSPLFQAARHAGDVTTMFVGESTPSPLFSPSVLNLDKMD